MTPQSRTFRTAMAAAVMLSVAAIVTVLLLLHQRISDMRLVDRDNPLWIANQLQFEMLRFDTAAADYALGAVSHEDLTRRFDILWSRVNVFEESYVADTMVERGLDLSPVENIRNWLNDFDITIFAEGNSAVSANSRTEIATTLRQGAEVLGTDLRNLSLNVLNSETLEQKHLRDSLINLSNWMIALTVFALGLLGFFGAFLWVDSARSRAAAREMEALANDATASLRAKDNFITVVSHELRTPLTSINGSVELLKADTNAGFSKTQEQLIGMAHRNCKTLIALVDDILDVEKLDAGKVSVSTVRFNLSDTVEGAVEASRGYAAQLDVTLDSEEIEPKLWVEGDAERISMVLGNLLTNASKFSHSGNIVKITARRNGGRARVEVHDDGQGIPSEEQDHVFDRFFQGSQTTSTTYKGTGLGLSISKRIIELHDGLIGFESEAGRGSTFWIELDLAA